ncbi:methyltransferase family protein [Microterricola pindariensis]|uniref:methyltransferase family protein n=1 Tax=Microterricola pindariensis TaxID=478010 RepID=UPI000CEB8B26|nr:methyltransferase [Microterricola pindariensis]
MPAPGRSRLSPFTPGFRGGARLGRAYFAAQAAAGALWWIGVFSSDAVRTATLGGLDAVAVAALDVPLFVAASALVAAGIRAVLWVLVPWTAIVTAGMVLYATVTGLAGWGVLLMLAALLGTAAAGFLVTTGWIPAARLVAGPLGFRLARPAAPRVQVGRTAGQIVVFWGLFLGVIPAVIVFVEGRWQLGVDAPIAVRFAGGALLAAASALGLWAAFTMSTRGEGTPLPSAMPRKLVIAGPYRLVRNPMAVAGIAQGVAVGLLSGSWLVVLYALSGSVVWNYLVRPLEEADLEARFGAEFDAYRRAVACWVPRRHPLPASASASS